ncbi:MAG: hypothetical protein J7L91_02770 [Candidatus Korarchaeota archaeon]|nr:hypothetical protein [Candidatus Korarchaeota archaeon]
MKPSDVWQEFLRDRDIAKAGRRILELARGLRIEISEYLSSGETEERRTYSPRRLRRDVIIRPKVWRLPRRYPMREELVGAFKWVERKLRTVARTISMSLITKWDLMEEIGKIKERILAFKSRGRRVVSLYELIRSREELVPILISLLFMERDGEIELLQDRPFDEIYVVLKDEGSGVVGKSKEVT